MARLSDRNDGWTERERSPRAGELEKREADGWLGWDGLMGRSYFPTKLLRSEKMPKKDQIGLKPRRWTPQRSIPKKCGIDQSHPDAVSTGDNPKTQMAQNPKDSLEKTRNSFSHARLGMLLHCDEGHPTRSAPASTWGCVDVPAGPEVGWDIPGASWIFIEGEGELGRSKVVGHLCPS